LIEEIFGASTQINEIFRAQPGMRIAPAEGLWIAPAAAAKAGNIE